MIRGEECKSGEGTYDPVRAVREACDCGGPERTRGVGGAASVVHGEEFANEEREADPDLPAVST